MISTTSLYKILPELRRRLTKLFLKTTTTGVLLPTTPEIDYRNRNRNRLHPS